MNYSDDPKGQNESLKESEAYKSEYEESRFMDKVLKSVLYIGEELAYNLFVGFYLLQDERVPVKVKATIVGALGYFIAPLDLIPDIIPVAGFADDASAVAGAIAIAACYITPDIKKRAREKVNDLFH